MWPDGGWHGGRRGRGELLGPDGINGAQRLEAAEDQTRACGAAMVTARVVQALCIRTRMSAFTRKARMTDHIRLQTWVTQGRSWYRSKAAIAAVTCPGRLPQGGFDRLSENGIGEGGHALARPALCAKTTRGSSISRWTLGVSAASPSATLGWACSGVARDAAPSERGRAGAAD